MLALLVQPQYATDAFPSSPNISNITSLPVNPNAPLTSTAAIVIECLNVNAGTIDCLIVK